MDSKSELLVYFLLFYNRGKEGQVQQSWFNSSPLKLLDGRMERKP